MKSVRTIDQRTAKFGGDVLELINGQTAKSQRQIQGMVSHILRSNWRPSEPLRLNAFDPPTRNDRVRRAAKARNRRQAKRIVDSLLFETIDDREHAIPQAYKDTFEWLFQAPWNTFDGEEVWSDFTRWLRESSDKIYWITGKPGAGKSTLIKFLAQDTRLRSLLLEWAGDSELLLGSYYSWNAGNNLQKSHEGLLRTLLHQCLSTNPELLVPVALPSRWTLTQLFGSRASLPEWRMEDLMAAFRALLGASGRDLSGLGHRFKVAVVVDGLDEFEGKHAELVELLQQANSNPSVKICASSRPWHVFRDAFKQNPMLLLERLTENDIALYVRGKFNDSRGFVERRALNGKEAENLLRDIVTKAQGVFLWVAVVVRDLLEHLQEGDRLADLQATLDSLPKDLSKLFQVIWERTNARHHGEASQYFQIVETYERFNLTPYAVSVWLGDDDVSLDFDFNQLTNSFMADATSSMARRIDSRTKGLLEIYDTAGARASRIDYLHRTAREWVKANWTVISATSKQDFQPHLWILKGEMLRMSVDNHVVPNFQYRSFWSHLGKLLDVAGAVPETAANAEALVQTMDRLDRRVTAFAQIKGRDGGSILLNDSAVSGQSVLPHWCNGTPPADDVGPTSSEHVVDFMGLAAQIPISSYVKRKASQDPRSLAVASPTTPILMSVVFGAFTDHPVHRSLGCSRSNGQERLNLARFVLGHVGLAEARDTLTSVQCQLRLTSTAHPQANDESRFLSAVESILNKQLEGHHVAPTRKTIEERPTNAPQNAKRGFAGLDTSKWFANPGPDLAFDESLVAHYCRSAKAKRSRLRRIGQLLSCISDR